MAFDAGTASKKQEGGVVVEVVMEIDGEKKTSRYLLRQITRGEMVRLMAESRKKSQGSVDLDIVGRIFENGDELDGGMSLYDLMDRMEESRQESFMSHVSELAVASRSRLSAMGVEVR